MRYTSRRGTGAPRRRCTAQMTRRGPPRKRGPHVRPRLSRRRETPARRANALAQRRGYRREVVARKRVEEQRRREVRNRKNPEEGAEKPSYRSERDPAVPDMRRTSQRGTGAPWRRCARTEGTERASEEERPAPTTGPRFRTREPAPRPVPPAEVRRRPEIPSGDQAGATETAAARQTAKNKSFPAKDGKPPLL